MLAEGTLTLTALCLLSRHLTPANHRSVLDTARYSTKREVEAQVAALQPKPPALAFVRKAPTPVATGTRHRTTEQPLLCSGTRLPGSQPDAQASEKIGQVATIQPRQISRLTPLAPDTYKVQLTVSRATHDKLREAQDLMRHVVPTGDLALIFDRAISLLLEELRRRRWAAAERPRPSHDAKPGSRHVPATVKREVWRRDGGRCAFVGKAGRCSERGLLELHHVVPFADGGLTTSANLQLRCRAHNAYEAQQYFGEWLTG